MLHATLRDVIEANIERVTESGCWIWVKTTSPAGYGRFTFRKKWHAAHRASYEAFIRPLREGEVVMHTCDVTCCCNPAHLLAATPQKNSEDAVRKGRMRPYGAKLTARDVKDIRRAYAAGTPAYYLARECGVNKATIHGVISRRYWKHVA